MDEQHQAAESESRITDFIDPLVGLYSGAELLAEDKIM